MPFFFISVKIAQNQEFFGFGFFSSNTFFRSAWFYTSPSTPFFLVFVCLHDVSLVEHVFSFFVICCMSRECHLVVGYRKCVLLGFL